MTMDLPPKPALWLPPKPAIVQPAHGIRKASFLPGWFPAGAAAAAAVLTTLTQVESATSTTASVLGPAGIQAGDLLVLKDYAASSGGVPTTVLPSGFNPIVNFDNTTTRKTILSLKIATGAEASASLTGMDGDVADRKELYVFRGNVPIVAAVANDVASEFTSGNPAAQTANASGAAVPLVVIGGYGAANPVDPRTFSPAKDGEINASTDSYLAYKIYNTTPADVSIDMDDEGTVNFLCSCYITCT